jgi:serine/threonine protein kinase
LEHSQALAPARNQQAISQKGKSKQVTPENWQQAKDIIHAALELESGERSVFLDTACAGDYELRCEIESLLQYEEQENSFIEISALEVTARALAEDVPQAMVGQHIGPYRILREVGRGGMGTVYLAEQGEYRREVALKLIKRGMDTDDIIRRFRHEQQILAGLNHTNIACLYGGGTTGDGRPYFIMEFVEGLPITEYAFGQDLTTTQRLELFRAVCSAVQFAHQNLIIHRDLKPSNILVTADGVPKLLDFGIAKLLRGDETLETHATETFLRVMTPEYASPEQVRGERITTASDIYSLGVVLYELLTGQRPYEFKSRNPEEFARAVCYEEPERPSSAVSRAENDQNEENEKSATPDKTAQGPMRTGSIDRLQRSLRGDVDNIVLMAMRKEATRRYQSVDQLSEDITRHLDGLTVRARKDTFSYRSSKFIRRNRPGVVAAAAVVLALLAGIIVSTLQARRADRRFNDVRKLAHSVLFDYHDAIANLPGSTPVRQRLVKDALEYLDSLSSEAGGDISLQRELATAYEKVGRVQGNSYDSNLGDTDGAMRSYLKSLELRERVAKNDPNNSGIRDELANSHEGLGDMFSATDDLKSALQHYKQALDMRRSLLSSDPGNKYYKNTLADLCKRVGDLQGNPGSANLGDTAGALESYGESIRLFEELIAATPDSREYRVGLSNGLLNVGYIMGVRGEPLAGVEYSQRAIKLMEGVVGEDLNDAKRRAELLSAYALMRPSLLDSGRLAEAIVNDRKLVPMLEAMSAADPQNSLFRRNLGVAFNYLGKDLRAAGRGGEAVDQHRKALAIAEALVAANVKSAEHKHDLAATRQALAEALEDTREYAAALENFRKAILIKEDLSTLEPSNVRHGDDLASLYAGVSRILAQTGDRTGAQAMLLKAVPLAEKAAEQSQGNPKPIARLAQRYFEAGQLQAKVAQLNLDNVERAMKWREAKYWYLKSLGIWQDLQGQRKLNIQDGGRPDETRHEIAKCDEKLKTEQ